MKNFFTELICPTNARSAKRQNRALGIALALVAVLVIVNCAGAASQKQTTTAWVICQPGDWVYAREWPNRNGDGCGMLDTGYKVELDGKTKNGFAHCVDVALEQNECWVYAGYLVFDEPQWMNGAWYKIDANGRVAARKYIDGPRRCWVVRGSTVQVFWMSEEWAVTMKGFIRSEYLRAIQ